MVGPEIYKYGAGTSQHPECLLSVHEAMDSTARTSAQEVEQEAQQFKVIFGYTVNLEVSLVRMKPFPNIKYYY